MSQLFNLFSLTGQHPSPATATARPDQGTPITAAIHGAPRRQAADELGICALAGRSVGQAGWQAEGWMNVAIASVIVFF